MNFLCCWYIGVAFLFCFPSTESFSPFTGIRRDAPLCPPRVSIQQRHLLPSRQLIPRIRTISLPSDLALPKVLHSLFQHNGNVPFVQALGMNLLLFFSARSKLLSALTPSGFAHALALGTMLWTTLGWRGWSYCVLYLIFGQAVTKVRFEEKQKAGLAEGRGGRRGPENVWGSAAISLACALASVRLDPCVSPLLLLGFCAGLATKLADTFASEIGKAYGKTTFLITTFQRTEPGTEGAVSVEGTVAAALGGLILSLYGYSIGLIPSLPAVGISTLAAFLATNVESYLGATIQEGKFITNEVINFINTVIGAGMAMCGGKFLLGM